MNLSDFLHMSGYAGFVWSAFGIAAVVLVANVFAARRRHRAVLDQLRRRYATQGEDIS